MKQKQSERIEMDWMLVVVVLWIYERMDLLFTSLFSSCLRSRILVVIASTAQYCSVLYSISPLDVRVLSDFWFAVRDLH